MAAASSSGGELALGLLSFAATVCLAIAKLGGWVTVSWFVVLLPWLLPVFVLAGCAGVLAFLILLVFIYGLICACGG